MTAIALPLHDDEIAACTACRVAPETQLCPTHEDRLDAFHAQSRPVAGAFVDGPRLGEMEGWPV